MMWNNKIKFHINFINIIDIFVKLIFYNQILSTYLYLNKLYIMIFFPISFTLYFLHIICKKMRVTSLGAYLENSLLLKTTLSYFEGCSR
jgi:hypothetical protein